tara:strand:+ start:31 stop:393 length:363 start_codon:yes stop_codon:yes gene_type:complete
MANRDFKNVQALEREIKILAFRVSGLDNSTNTVTPSTGVASSTISGDRVTITLTDKYSSLLSAQLTMGASDGTSISGNGPLLQSHDVSGAKTVLVDMGGATPDANDTLDVALFLKNSSVT